MKRPLAIGLILCALAGGGLAHDRHGNANWIRNGAFLSPIDGSHCCGINDCFEVQSDDVNTNRAGYFLVRFDEQVPHREVQTSRDGQYWRCKKPDGSRRCFFAPPPSM